MEDRFRFRVWNKRDKKMIYNAEDVYDGSLSGWCGNENNNNDGWISCFGEYLGREEYVVMQCTELKDKNGKLIYEGDIVKVSGYGVEGIFKIFWDDTTARFCSSIYESDCFEHSQSVMEVIGNIYENKELLEGK